jgi:hypothetical protein
LPRPGTACLPSPPRFPTDACPPELFPSEKRGPRHRAPMPPCRSSATPTRLRGLVPLGNPWCRRLVAEPCTRCSPGLPRSRALTRCPRSAHPKARPRRQPPPKRRTAEAVSIVSESAVHRDPRTACGPRAAPAAQRCREDERGRFVRPRAHMGHDVSVVCRARAAGVYIGSEDPTSPSVRRRAVRARTPRTAPCAGAVRDATEVVSDRSP